MDRFIVSARKYRPGSFETLIGQENIAKTLKNSILRDQLAHAYLFCGPRGVGKTTSARIFAKTINCLSPSADMDPCGVCESCKAFDENRSFSIHEMDAASNNSVEDIRLLNEKVRIPPQIGKYSVYIIDEVHMLSQAAFNAFLKTLEEPPAHAIFILATTEKHKIIPTILSRCQTYDFNRISVQDIVRNIKNIAQQEGVQIEDEAIHVIAKKADGAMRDALTLFDQSVAFCGDNVTYEQVISNLNILDYDYYLRLTDNFLMGNHTPALLILDEILSKGFNSLHFIGGLSSHFRDLLICKDPLSAKLLELAPSVIEKYKEQSEKCSFEFLFSALNITSQCESSYKASGNQRLHVEFALVKLSTINCEKEKVSEKVAAPQQEVKSEIKKEEKKEPITEESIKNNPEEATIPQESKPETPNVKEGKRQGPRSIKEMMQQAKEQTAKTERVIPKEIGTDSFDQMRLEAVWMEMAESEKSLQRLANAISSTKPLISENPNKIIFYVSNEIQKEWINSNCKLRLEAFLKEKLNNTNTELLVEVTSQEEANEGKLYMPEEKAKYLLEKHPELKELQKDLKLEIK
ncbi:MAG: DNA polymerase III subunit gamma/tau [Bacteroidales bacterium]|jgi:DNA polymerase-3 subunit gamma/tau|nr:DNA polymerase III subunit gamma/tau [Bacteroidales bacterium]MDD3272742.1 DNA polymerase III subunit gamma/tau [Bacteroidales bacterium]MDD4058129.1 DNA polymerase III subunit gamma/tau [Bacteroidales bacterium]